MKLQNLPDAVMAAAEVGASASSPESKSDTPDHGYRPAAIAAQLDTGAETTIVARVAEERREAGHTDLLDEDADQE